jgi:O-antigen ligase
MRQLFTIDDSNENKISYYHLADFVVTLPFDRLFSELALISFLVHTVIHLNKRKLKNILTLRALLVSSVFFITLIGISYSPEKSEGFKELGKQSAIILFPVLIACTGLDLKKYIGNILILFSLSCIISTLYLYFDAFHVILYNNLPLSTILTKAFLNHNFTDPIGLHATYFGMYALLSAIILFYFSRQSGDWRTQVLCLAGILILIAGLMQSASRSVLISAVVIAFSLPFILLNRKKRLRFIAEVVAILVLSGLLVTNISSFKMRYVAQFKNDLTQQSINNEMLEPRITRWEYIWQVVGKSPLVGHGTGMERPLLQEAYFQNKLYNSYLHELNSHNQYLAFLVETGAWGLFIFLATLCIGLVAAILQRNTLFLSFLVIFSVVSFSENLLDTNKGIFFYSCFFSVFAFAGKPLTRVLRFKRTKESAVIDPETKTVHAAIIRSHNNI